MTTTPSDKERSWEKKFSQLFLLQTMKQHLCKTFHTIVVHMTSTPNALKKKFNVDVLDDVDGLTFESNGQVVIWTRDSSKHVLVHECVHAAYAICRRCGVKHDEETIAYLTEEMWSALC